MRATLGSLLAIPLLASSAIHAAPLLIAGGVDDDAKAIIIGVQYPWHPAWLASPRLGIAVQVSLGYWRADDDDTGNRDLVDLAVLPTLRFYPGGRDSPGFFAEAGIGAHLLSSTQLGDRRFSTAFQFGDVVGIGWRFGEAGRYEVGLRYQHVSNASIKRPNPGFDFVELRAVLPW